jgi:hypothetical protein
VLSNNIKIKIFRTVMVPVVLCGHETCSVTLREEHRLRFFKNSVVRKLFEPKGDKVVGDWRRLCSFISNLSDDRSTASSKTIPPLNAI